MRTTVHATPRMRLPELAAKGLTQTEAARVLGVSRQRVSQLVAKLRLTFRPSYPSVPEKRLEELANKGLTQTEAARELGVSQTRVSRVGAELGLSFAPAWSRPKPAKSELGRIIQAARLEAGYSYGRLGEATGLHRQHIKAIERGWVRQPREKTLRALADSLVGYTTYDELDSAAWADQSPVSEQRLRELAEKGATQTEAARELGVSRERVKKHADRLGLSFPPAWSRPKVRTTEFGRVLQAARLAAGYSYSRLAALSGLHRRHVIELELGRVRRPKEQTLRALADCFSGHASYDDLVRALQKAEVPASARARAGGRRRRRTRTKEG